MGGEISGGSKSSIAISVDACRHLVMGDEIEMRGRERRGKYGCSHDRGMGALTL